ncbi:MAG: hypothetical protein K2L05_01795 [Muribaculaceae bacterium]|nr:hypothetical protein [Muribaculaceae bacterium]MDE7335594.1 hypothetical protein [Muribaculaceae bacterium]
MKKFPFIALAAAALAGCCSKAPQPQTVKEVYEQNLAQATTFADSLIAVDGSFIGGVFNNRFTDYPAEAVGDDKREVLRGIRTIMAVDTADRSYLSGLQMGLEIMDIYRQLASQESFSKEKFLEVISQAFMVDSLNRDELRELQPLFQQMFSTVELRAQQRAEAETYNSKEASENRMMAAAVATKLKSNPDFREVGSDGLMQKTLTEGNGEVISPSQLITVSITERRAESGEVLRSIAPMQVYAGRPGHPVLASVIPFMSVGETAVFFVPYQLAYGTNGDASAKVGPCESIMAEVTIEEIKE